MHITALPSGRCLSWGSPAPALLGWAPRGPVLNALSLNAFGDPAESRHATPHVPKERWRSVSAATLLSLDVTSCWWHPASQTARPRRAWAPRRGLGPPPRGRWGCHPSGVGTQPPRCPACPVRPDHRIPEHGCPAIPPAASRQRCASAPRFSGTPLVPPLPLFDPSCPPPLLPLDSHASRRQCAPLARLPGGADPTSAPTPSCSAGEVQPILLLSPPLPPMFGPPPLPCRAPCSLSFL